MIELLPQLPARPANMHAAHHERKTLESNLYVKTVTTSLSYGPLTRQSTVCCVFIWWCVHTECRWAKYCCQVLAQDSHDQTRACKQDTFGRQYYNYTLRADWPTYSGTWPFLKLELSFNFPVCSAAHFELTAAAVKWSFLPFGACGDGDCLSQYAHVNCMCMCMYMYMCMCMCLYMHVTGH